MPDKTKLPIVDLANALRRDINIAKANGSLGRTVLLIGAGCSVSAKIPLAKEIAQNLVCELAHAYGVTNPNQKDPQTCLNLLIDQNYINSNDIYINKSNGNREINWSSVYDEIFSKHYNSPKEVHRIFSDIFEKNGKSINWTHICIGELVRAGYISTVLTTNFDQLALEGIARTGRLPIVADGLEYLGRITGDPIHPQLVQIHGSRHTYHLRNSIEDVDELSREHSARHAIDELFRTAMVFVVVGYGGREKGIMRLLLEAGKRYPDTRIFWCTYSEKQEDLPALVTDFLATSKLSSVIHGYDSDELFDEILNLLGIKAPKIIDDPLYILQELTENIAFSADSTIARKVGSLKLKTQDLKVAEEHLSALSQNQKMQVIGQLAAGVAHDVNNVITSILFSTDHQLLKKDHTDPDFADLMEIKRSANRASVLVRQLIAFARKQTLNPIPINIRDALSDLRMLMDRLIGVEFELQLLFADKVWPIKADLPQFEQVIINLVVNARDAMPSGGKIVIGVNNISAEDSGKLNLPDIEPGDYVEICVIDYGTGIHPDYMDRIFEPYFTTKEVGKGTGLGLSMSYGIIRQSGGHIFVNSELGKGTEVHILMPRFEGTIKPTTQASELSPTEQSMMARGSETILVADDEDAVRAGMVRMLESRGYKVYQAGSGLEALDIISGLGRNGQSVDLVISNVVMPQMDGIRLYEEIRETNPDIKVVFISGYAEDAFAKRLPEGAVFGFLPKPFSLKQLAGAVRQMLEFDGDPQRT